MIDDLPARMCASNLGPAITRAVGRLDAGARTMASQQAHASLGRMADHAEAGRFELQLLSHVLARRPHVAIANQAGIGCRRIGLLVTWQMAAQWTAHRLLVRRYQRFKCKYKQR